MSNQNADGQINLTITDGSTLTGLYAPDGSYNAVINDGTQLLGIRHPSGAFNVVVNETASSFQASNGSINIQTQSDGLGYTFLDPPGIVGIPSFVTRADGVAADVDMNFKTNQYWGKQLSDLTCQRSTNKMMLFSDGSYQNLAQNTLPISDLGLQPENLATNTLVNNANLAVYNSLNQNTPTAQISPDGTTNAWLSVPNTTAGARHNLLANATTTAAVFTFSAFFKPAGYNFGFISISSPAGILYHSIVFDLTSGAITATNDLGSPTSTGQTVVVYPNGWVRASVTMLCAAGTTTCSFGASLIGTPSPVNASAGEPQYTGDGTSGVILWLPQLEGIASATSPIVTGASFQTRASDSIFATIPVVGPQGGIVWKGQLTHIPFTNSIGIGVGDGTLTNELISYLNNIPNVLPLQGTGFTLTNAGAASVGTRQRIGAGWSSGGILSSYNGSSGPSTVGVPGGVNMTRFQIGGRNNASFFYNDFLEQISVWYTHGPSQTALNTATTS